MATVSVNGTSLDFSERGVGQPLVLVHGSASDQRTWHGQQAAFGERFRVIAYSRRYHWPNEPIAEGADYSMLEQVDDLGAFLEAAGAAPAHLVGHSYGGFLCLLLAIRQPHLVRTLVLAEPPVVTLFVSSTPRASEVLKLLLTRPRTALAILKFGATGIAPAIKAARRGDMAAANEVFGKAVLGREFYERLSAERREQVRLNTTRAELTGSGFAPLDADAVRRVRAPTLLIGGTRSPALFQRLTDRLEELLPNSERVRIDGASHIAHEDNAPAYNQAVLSFLQRASIRADEDREPPIARVRAV